MKAVKVIILLSAITILQLYSAFFWFDVVGDEVGYLLSIVIEVVSLWLWFEGEKHLAATASFVVMMGAILHLASGSINMIEETKDAAVVDKALSQLTNTLEKSDANGHYMTRQKSIDAIAKVVVAASDKKGPKKKESIGFTWLKIAIQALGLIIIQLGQIKIVLSMKQKTVTIQPRPVTTPKTSVTKERNSLEDTSAADLAKVVLNELHRYKTAKGLQSNNATADMLQVSRPIFKRLLDTVNTGKGVSVDKMNEILNQLKREL